MKKFLLFILLLPIICMGQSEKSKEQLFVEQYFPHVRICDFTPGAKFMFATSILHDDEIEVPAWLRNHKDWSKLPGDSKKKLLGKEITLTYVGDKKVKPSGIYNKQLCAVMEFQCDGLTFTMDMDAPMAERTECTPPLLPLDLIWIDEINKAKDILIGMQFYSKPQLHHGYKEHISDKPQSMQYVQFTIDDISSTGKRNEPVRIFATNEFGHKIYFDCALSDYDQMKGMWNLKGLHNLILIDNPRDMYPYITDDNWELIRLRQVKLGMTNVECVLAWGEPKKKNSIIANNVNETTYYYDENRALVFENGVLIIIHK